MDELGIPPANDWQTCHWSPDGEHISKKLRLESLTGVKFRLKVGSTSGIFNYGKTNMKIFIFFFKTLQY